MCDVGGVRHACCQALFINYAIVWPRLTACRYPLFNNQLWMARDVRLIFRDQ